LWTSPEEKVKYQQFELQNQMNSQIIAQITEISKFIHKVAKLKAWKKIMKQDLYEE